MMSRKNENQYRHEALPSRREMIGGVLKTMFVAGLLPAMPMEAANPAAAPASSPDWRVVNIMNFIRAEEPRNNTDLMAPVRGQMALVRQYQFPATWLLQYDALVEGPFVEFLKKEMTAEHETGIWLEMNRRLCEDADIAWRGNPQWEWDYHVPVAYAIGYTPDERRKLADTAVATHKKIFGRDVKSVASWNLDAVTVAHLADHYGIDAFGNCRDQLNTDGFTIWGAPIAAYYPNRVNAWSPAVEASNQVNAPIFRLLGQDPVYYYDNRVPYPDTMEPVWKSGKSEIFVDTFFDMMAHSPTQKLAYVQLGQENSFGWPAMSAGYAMQMEKLARLRDSHALRVETMGDTGRRFKAAFKATPTQAQVMLKDPYGERGFAGDGVTEKSVWYQSKFLRANLHFRGDEFYLRDLHVYDDRFPQPWLTEPVKQNSIEQRMLAVLDGYHWSDDAVRAGHAGRRAMGRFVVIREDGVETPLTMTGAPGVSENGPALQTTVAVSREAGGGSLVAVFNERDIGFQLTGVARGSRLGLVFEWVPERSTFKKAMALVVPRATEARLEYRYLDFDYSVHVVNATAAQTATGVKLVAKDRGGFRLGMAQV